METLNEALSTSRLSTSNANIAPTQQDTLTASRIARDILSPQESLAEVKQSLHFLETKEIENSRGIFNFFSFQKVQSITDAYVANLYVVPPILLSIYDSTSFWF